MGTERRSFFAAQTGKQMAGPDGTLFKKDIQRPGPPDPEKLQLALIFLL